ncbi:MAG: hypothetical protein KC731_36995 [Myxococcales bacterium]|nr:hypothetical protein [Myxococcales bacterium]
MAITLMACTSLPARQAWADDEELLDPSDDPPGRYAPSQHRTNPRGSVELGVGIALTAVGGLGVLGGSVALFGCAAHSLEGGSGCPTSTKVLGGIGIGGGVLGLAIGIPLIVSGKRARHHADATSVIVERIQLGALGGSLPSWGLRLDGHF